MTMIPNHFPVNVILNQSLQLFENFCDPYEIQMNLRKGLSNRIKLEFSDRHITDFAACTLHYDEQTGEPFCQIVVWDNYCQYLWSLCYASTIVMDKFIIEPYLNPAKVTDEERLKTAYDLFMKGMSLFDADVRTRATRSDFFSLPNPDNNPDDESVKAANTLFDLCLCFVLFHEYHHFNLGHMGQPEKKADEFEADFSAFYSMYADRTLVEKKIISMAIILTMGSILLIDDTLDGGATHPDPDDRLGSILSHFNDLDAQGKDYCYGMAFTIYKLWAFYYSKEALIPKVAEIENIEAYFKLIQQAVTNSKHT